METNEFRPGLYTVRIARTKHGRAFAERALPWQDMSPEGLEHNHLEDLTDLEDCAF